MSSLHYSTEDRPKSTPINSEQVYLEGECIVVPDGYVFPQICLVTGDSVSTPPVKYRFPRTKYVSEVDMAPGSLDALFAGKQRSHFGPKSAVSFCLNDRLTKRRRSLAIWAVGSILLAFVLPIALLALTQNSWSLLLFFVLMAVAGFCVWKRDNVIFTTKVTPSLLWLKGVNPVVREEIYRSGVK